MKKQEGAKKLSLLRENLRSVGTEEMKLIAGGDSQFCPGRGHIISGG
jgi:hypothetical protein